MLSKIVQLLYPFAQHSVMVIRALKLICSAVTHRSTRLIGKNNWLQKAEFSNQRTTLGVPLFACFFPLQWHKDTRPDFTPVNSFFQPNPLVSIQNRVEKGPFSQSELNRDALRPPSPTIFGCRSEFLNPSLQMEIFVLVGALPRARFPGLCTSLITWHHTQPI